MTIGDEKVVAWRDVIVPSHASSDQLYNWNAEAVSRDEAESKIAALHSAYAELAAERDALDDRCVMLHGFAEHMRRRAESAESQLAELRGRLEGLASGYAAEAERHLMHAANKDWAEWVRADHSSRASELNGAAREIRTLAAADGGG